MRKFISVLLAVLLLGSLSVSAFAAGIEVPANIKQVAADAVGISADKVFPVEVEMKGGNYEFDFNYNRANYEFEIAADGTIVEFSYDKNSIGGDGIFVIKTGGPYISVEEAKAAAFAKAGIQAKNAKRVEVSFEIDRSKAVFDVSFNADGYEYDVDAKTGAANIVEKEQTGINAGGISGFFAKIKAFFADIFAMIKGWFTK